MQCPRCQRENRPDATFCDGCGAPLKHSSASTQPAPSYADVQSSLAESLTQQTATSEILGVISRSQTDVHPVFETIAANALRLCGAKFSLICMYDGELIHIAVLHNVSPEDAAAMRDAFPMPPGRGGATARAVLTRSIVHIPDVLADPEYRLRRVAETTNARNALSVPLLRDGEPIGALTVGGDAVRPFSERQVALLETFADQAVIAIENVRLFNETKEALEQQTATSQILGVISQSPTDVQPVFETIVQSAAQLCEATFAVLHRFDGQLITFDAHHGMSEQEVAGSRDRFPLPTDRGTAVGRAILDRRTTHIHDIRRDAEYRVSAWQASFQTVLAVPLLREGVPVGAIGLWRREVRPFSKKQIRLVETFADQAVIAIENVRLFKELEEKNSALTAAHTQVTESLEQQTATSEVLKVISRSPTDVQPVFDAIVESAVRLCEAEHATVYQFDGTLQHFVAHYNVAPSALTRLRARYPRPPVHTTTTGAAILGRRVVHVPDIDDDPIFPETREVLDQGGGGRSVLSVPMLRDGESLGAIFVSRGRGNPRPFSATQVELLQTFADQAVIAIENVRLFTEVQRSNRELTTALDEQTATSEILRVISSSPTDVQPVFDAIAQRAMTLCRSQQGAVLKFDGELLHIVAIAHTIPGWAEIVHRAFPRRPGPGSASARAIMTRAVVHIPDVLAEPEYEFREGAIRVGIRAVLSVPMVREGQVVGTITLDRTEPVPFSDNQIALLQTFADQAVIAVENVRLFTELQEKNGALTQAHAQVTETLEQQTATSDVLRVISRSPTDVQPVFDTIIRNAVQLCGARLGSFFHFDGEQLHLMANHGHSLESLAVVRRAYPMRPDRTQAAGRSILDRAVTEIPDALEDPAYDHGMALAMDWRSVLAVPLLRGDGSPIGVIVIQRQEGGHFAPGHVELLQTFADQAVIAIENVRLFKELEAANRELAAASQHKSEFLANMSHELRTPLNAIIGFSEVLSEKMFGELNEKQEEYSKDIHASGQHLLSLINDILDLSKIEAGRMELELTDFHLPTALDNGLTLVRERAGRRSIALQMSVDERLGEVRADERKIRQVVLNLLSNAIKFTPEGGRIEVGAVPKDGFVEVSVTDTGVGIAPEDQEAVFEEFRQVGTADKKAEGTGLGLTLCRKFIELHGGKIWVKSQPGQGSTFTFRIPVRQGE